MAGRPNDAGAIGGHIQGLREAKAAFMRLPEAMRERTNEANAATAIQIRNGAQARILASPSINTRSLLNAIDYRVTKTNGRARVGVTSGSTVIQTSANFAKGIITGRKVRVKGIVVAGPGGGAAGGRVIRPSRYAHLVEFGAAQMAPEPFMMPAAAAEVQPHLDRLRRAGKEVERDLTGGGGLL